LNKSIFIPEQKTRYSAVVFGHEAALLACGYSGEHAHNRLLSAEER